MFSGNFIVDDIANTTNTHEFKINNPYLDKAVVFRVENTLEMATGP